MAGFKTEREYNIHSFDVDYRYELLPTRYISFLQDIAMWQSEKLGIGNDYLTQNNLAWVIIKYNIKIHKYPKYMDKIKIQTYPVCNRKLYSYRKFLTFDDNGELISEVDSVWMLVDSKKHKPAKLTEKIIKAYGFDENHIERIDFDGIKVLDTYDTEKKFIVRYSDIDSNKHVNNVVYVSWAIETMQKDDVLNYVLENIEVFYKKEAVHGNEISVKTKLDLKNEKNIIATHNVINEDGKLLCLLRTKWISNVL